MENVSTKSKLIVAAVRKPLDGFEKASKRAKEGCRRERQYFRNAVQAMFSRRIRRCAREYGLEVKALRLSYETIPASLKIVASGINGDAEAFIDEIVKMGSGGL